MLSTVRIAAISAAITAVAVTSTAAFAQKKYDTGASDTEIKIGNIIPYSGPASAYGVIGKTEEAYFKMINDRGGINGRKVNFVSYDDAYSPPKAVEQVRKLVESDEVLLVFNPLGTPSNTAIQKYLNSKKIPQLFVATGATKWNDPKNFPWTMGWQPSYQSEAQIYAKWLMKEKPDAKVAILYQNDDFGKDYLKGTKDGFGAKGATSIIMEESYEISEPSIDSHIVKIKAANPDVLLIYTTPKFGAQAIRKVADLGWKPTHFIVSVASSIGGVLEPAGLEASTGLMTALATKVVGDPAWDTDKGVQDYLAFMKQWYPEGNPIDGSNQIGYLSAQFTAIILKNCGDELTRENLLKQATNISKVSLPLLLPGITVSVSPTDYSTFDTFKLAKFDGKTWKFFGENISTASR